MMSEDPPRPPYFAVIFSSLRTESDNEGYGRAAERMMELAARQPGFLGVESARDDRGEGITVSYWRSLEDIRRWKLDAEHATAQRQGRERWYERYRLRIAQVTEEYSFARPKAGG
jgi:heme-degrading monooxygenase HmoA